MNIMEEQKPTFLQLLATGSYYLADTTLKNGKFGRMNFRYRNELDPKPDEITAVVFEECTESDKGKAAWAKRNTFVVFPKDFYFNVISEIRIFNCLDLIESHLTNNKLRMLKNVALTYFNGNFQGNSLSTKDLARLIEKLQTLQKNDPPLFDYLCDEDVEVLKSCLRWFIAYLISKQSQAAAEPAQTSSVEADAPKPATKAANNRVKPFEDCILHPDKEMVISRLTISVGNGSGKDAAFTMAAALSLGWISKKPTYNQMKNQFGNIGNESGYNAQWNTSQSTDNGNKEEVASYVRKLTKGL